MPARTAAAILCLTACLLAGCSRRTVADAPWAFEASGPVAIDVELFAGDVEVTADPRITQAVVRIERESTHGFDRAPEAEQAMEEIDVAAELVPGGEAGGTLRVRATTTHAEPHFLRANISIDVPGARDVTIRTARGAVRVRDAVGSIDIHTTDDDVVLVSERSLVDPITIMTRYGDIDLRCRPGSRGELDVQAVGGRVFHKVRQGRLIVRPGTTGDTVLATLNTGRNPIMLRTVDGDIRIVVDENPAAFGHFILP